MNDLVKMPEGDLTGIPQTAEVKNKDILLTLDTNNITNFLIMVEIMIYSLAYDRIRSITIVK